MWRNNTKLNMSHTETASLCTFGFLQAGEALGGTAILIRFMSSDLLNSLQSADSGSVVPVAAKGGNPPDMCVIPFWVLLKVWAVPTFEPLKKWELLRNRKICPLFTLSSLLPLWRESHQSSAVFLVSLANRIPFFVALSVCRYICTPFVPLSSSHRLWSFSFLLDLLPPQSDVHRRCFVGGNTQVLKHFCRETGCHYLILNF